VGCILAAPHITQVAVRSGLVVIRTTIGTRSVHCSEAQRRGQLAGLADAPLRVHKRNADTVEDEGGDIVEADGLAVECAQPVEEGERRQAEPRVEFVGFHSPFLSSVRRPIRKVSRSGAPRLSA